MFDDLSNRSTFCGSLCRSKLERSFPEKKILYCYYRRVESYLFLKFYKNIYSLKLFLIYSVGKIFQENFEEAKDLKVKSYVFTCLNHQVKLDIEVLEHLCYDSKDNLSNKFQTPTK